MTLSDPLQISFSLADIKAAAHQLWRWANGARVFTFSGSLGAGKTTLIHAICEIIGVEDAVSSPTFALINEYQAGPGRQIVLHMDWYRLRDAAEAVDAGMEDALHNEDCICFVEWPEKAAELLVMPHVAISIAATDLQTRLLSARQLN